MLGTDYSVRQICETLGFTQSNLYSQSKKDSCKTVLRDVRRCDQVWVPDITYVRLKGCFIYVCLLMDVFTCIIRGWQISQHLTQSLTLKPLEAALRHSAPEIHYLNQGVQYLSSAYISLLRHHDLEISVARRGVLRRTDMLKDLSAPSRKKKFTSTIIRTSTKREIVSVILSDRCITKNARIRR